jgi:hypothetical protein
MKRLPYRIAFAAIVVALAAACASAPDQRAALKNGMPCGAGAIGEVVDGKCVVTSRSARNSQFQTGIQRGSTFSPPSFPSESPSQ